MKTKILAVTIICLTLCSFACLYPKEYKVKAEIEVTYTNGEKEKIEVKVECSECENSKFYLHDGCLTFNGNDLRCGIRGYSVNNKTVERIN